jgi:hypothetical protein
MNGNRGKAKEKSYRKRAALRKPDRREQNRLHRLAATRGYD